MPNKKNVHEENNLLNLKIEDTKKLERNLTESRLATQVLHILGCHQTAPQLQPVSK